MQQKILIVDDDPDIRQALSCDCAPTILKQCTQWTATRRLLRPTRSSPT